MVPPFSKGRLGGRVREVSETIEDFQPLLRRPEATSPSPLLPRYSPSPSPLPQKGGEENEEVPSRHGGAEPLPWLTKEDSGTLTHHFLPLLIP